MDLIATERNETVEAKGVGQYPFYEIGGRLLPGQVDDHANGAVAHLLVQTPVVSPGNPNGAVLDLGLELYGIHPASHLTALILCSYCSTTPLILKARPAE
jgi:hypothetical protein